ncbi:MAG: hypothetical protein AAEJ57_03690, partial [Opitutales bacterium]
VSDDLSIAAEYAEKDNETGDDIEGWLVMGDYTVNGKMSLTLRYSEEEIGSISYEKFTIAPNYAISDELLGVIEYSAQDASDNSENDFLGIRLLYRF